MKIVAILCSKNDGDIIESCIRINSRLFDEFLIYDESTDQTRFILSKLLTEGFKIHFFDGIGRPYRQDQIMTRLCHIAAEKDGISADFIFPLDIDEFPSVVNRFKLEEFLDGLEESKIGAYNWRTFIPVANSQIQSPSHLKNNYRARIPEGSSFSKVIIPGQLADDIFISVGSHDAFSISRLKRFPTCQAPFDLAHFPVRNIEQLFLKNATAVDYMLRKHECSQDEGFHVFITFKQLLNLKTSGDIIDYLGAACWAYCNNNPLRVGLGDTPSWIPSGNCVYTVNEPSFVLRELASLLYKAWSTPISDSHFSRLS